MKKTMIFVITLIVVLFCFTGGAFAESKDNFYVFEELFQQWQQNGYPDYVCGVWIKNGDGDRITVSVLKGEEGEKGKREILEYIGNKTSVSFEYGEYSYNELLSVRNEIMKDSLEKHILSAGVSNQANKVYVGMNLHSGTDEQTEKTMSELKALYGDMIVFIDDAPIDASIGRKIIDIQQLTVLVALIMVTVSGIFVAVLIMSMRSKRKGVAIEAATGEETAIDKHFSFRQTENYLREAVLCPPEDLDNQIKTKCCIK